MIYMINITNFQMELYVRLLKLWMSDFILYFIFSLTEINNEIKNSNIK